MHAVPSLMEVFKTNCNFTMRIRRRIENHASARVKTEIEAPLETRIGCRPPTIFLCEIIQRQDPRLNSFGHHVESRNQALEDSSSPSYPSLEILRAGTNDHSGNGSLGSQVHISYTPDRQRPSKAVTSRALVEYQMWSIIPMKPGV